MTYVPNQKYDIFVSYAHVDDEPLPGADTGWVSTLVKGLETRLAQRLGRHDSYSLWMDHELPRNAQVTPTILDTLDATATLLVVLSPGYIASEWCSKERTQFLEQVRKRVRSGSRVFVVERDRVEQRPPEFSDLIGYSFWVEDRAGRPPRILGTPTPRPDDDKYYDLVNDLSHEIAQELQRLKEASGPHLQSAPAPAFKTPVFLAETTDDLDAERNNVRRYLDQAGVPVLPRTFYPLDPDSFRQAVERDLAQCDLFVQLLSGVPGKKPPDLPQGYSRLQYDLAQAHGKEILQWRSPDLDLETIDAQQRIFLEFETVRSEAIEDFKREIKQRASRMPREEQTRPLHAFIFVDMEGSDRPLAREVCGVLESYGAEYALPVESDKPSENRQDLEQNLLFSDGVIIVYGSATVTWVRERLRQCRKVLIKRQSPLQALAVFEGPPKEKPPLDLKLQNMNIIDCRTGFDTKELRGFLDRLQPARLQ